MICLLSNPQWQMGVLSGCETKKMVRGSEPIHWTVFSLLAVFSVDLNVLWLDSVTGHVSAPFQCPPLCPWLSIHFSYISKGVDKRAYKTKVVVWETQINTITFALLNIKMLISCFFFSKEVEENTFAFNFTHLHSVSYVLKSYLRTKWHFQDGWCVSIILFLKKKASTIDRWRRALTRNNEQFVFVEGSQIDRYKLKTKAWISEHLSDCP